MKNQDMKHYGTARRTDPSTLTSAIIIIALIATLFIDWYKREQIISQTNHAILERDRYIDELENVIDQIYMQQTFHQDRRITL